MVKAVRMKSLLLAVNRACGAVCSLYGAEICMPLAFLADFVIIEVDFFEVLQVAVAERKIWCRPLRLLVQSECRGQARGTWNLVMLHARHPSTGIVFLFFFLIGSAIAYCVHHLSPIVSWPY